MEKPFIVKRYGKGEYSTATLPDGVIETVWFPDDWNESSRVIGRTYPLTLASAAAKHITEWEQNHEI